MFHLHLEDRYRLEIDCHLDGYHRLAGNSHHHRLTASRGLHSLTDSSHHHHLTASRGLHRLVVSRRPDGCRHLEVNYRLEVSRRLEVSHLHLRL